jgi:hypothetical protein
MTTYNQAQVLEILSSANQDGCFEDEAEFLYGKLGQEFHALIEDTWAQTYLEESGLDLSCPPWKQQQDEETAQIQEWYSQYPQMMEEWQNSICRALLAGEYEVKEGTFWEQERVGTKQVQVTRKYFVVEGKKHYTMDHPYSQYNWAEKWVKTHERKLSEEQAHQAWKQDKEAALALEGQHDEVTVSVTNSGIDASITFTVKVFKPYGKELEEGYTVSKSFPYSTPLEVVLADIRAKAAEKAEEKEVKYTENKAFYTANQEKLAEGQKLFDQLTAAGKAEGFRMAGSTLEKLSTWKAKGGMRPNWSHIDAIEKAKRMLEVKSKPVIKRRNA